VLDRSGELRPSNLASADEEVSLGRDRTGNFVTGSLVLKLLMLTRTI
jgi:hypothetical protein